MHRSQQTSFEKQALLAAAIVLCTFSCESDSELRGQLVISIETDMALPDELDYLHVQVLPNGRTEVDNDYELGSSASSVKLPATLTLLAGEDPALPVTVRVAGSKDGVYRTFREVTTTVPYGRLTHLRMPLQWLCDETAEKVSSDPFSTAVRSTCSTGQSCVAGKCAKSQVSERDLPDFSARNVYGRADRPEDGKCFDTLPCMITGSVVTPDADCSIELPQRNNVNVALRVARGGICDASGAICFVALDGDSKEGWQVESDTMRVKLPEAVCDKLALGVISGVYVSTFCSTKTAADPPCGSWSSVTTKGDQPPSSVLSRAPKVELITQLDLKADGDICCPLLMDDAGLYTCTCPSPSEARILRIDPRDGSKSLAFKVSPPANRESLSFGATLADGAFFWVSERTMARVGLDGHESKTFPPLSGDAYNQSSLLSDDSTLMVLANRLEGKSGSPVQVLRVSFAGTVEALDTGGNWVVYQFAQHSDAIYVATDIDKPDNSSGSIARTSTIVRFDKRTGTRTQLVPTENLVTPSVDQGGYLGVQMGTDTLYGLYEAMSNPDGTTNMQLRAVDPESSSKTYEAIYEQSIDPSHTRLSMLSVVGNTPILSRIEYKSIEAGSGVLRSASIFAVTAKGKPPIIVADLAGDSPLPGLASDEQRVYLMTKGGALLGMARTGLP